MNNQHLWDTGLKSAKKLLNGLSSADRQLLSELMSDYRRQKILMAAVTHGINSETTCSDCSGKCCLNGKYRINVFDILTICCNEIQISPDFQQTPLCPYGTAQGCKLDPGFRPADCIVFICELLDGSLTDSARTDLAEYESSIRECALKASRLLSIPAGTPLLLWADGNKRFQKL